ncbi:RHS repeat domain-containing protein, partial [Thermovenabulum sp.]|uniref:RHS repeat domain-containing protein n=1 Tax=Thermovenabulum sp. TaxID=3100335 RepID=UPI003C7A43F8
MLAEYDGYGVCLREYIYIGAKMVAEYQPTTDKYYYYTADQINSTRVVTDDLGNVVYAAAHDPYGGIQQIWVNTFNPELKFSGKEQDTESSLYYFGARYYEPTLYRFLSPDPADVPEVVRYDFQRWNKYCFAKNNPISYIEANGLLALKVSWNVINIEAGKSLSSYHINHSMMPYAFTTILAGDLNIEIAEKKEISITVTFTTFILPRSSGWWKTFEPEMFGITYDSVLRHELMHVIDVILFVKHKLDKIEAEYKSGKISEAEAKDNIQKAFNKAMKASIWLRDNFISEYIGHIINGVKELFPDYGIDPFWQWVLAPHLF